MSKKMLWTILGPEEIRSKIKYILCRCICGTEKFVRKTSYGRDSFGCKKCRNYQRTHGKTRSNLYKRWTAMKQRCFYKNHNNSELYLNRGITVCKEWVDSFEVFQKWALENGFKEELSLDRIDNDKGYSPENCRWTTPYEQNRNQRTNIRLEWGGKNMILKDWCKHQELNYDTVRNRIYRGMSVSEALELTFE